MGGYLHLLNPASSGVYALLPGLLTISLPLHHICCLTINALFFCVSVHLFCFVDLIWKAFFDGVDTLL